MSTTTARVQILRQLETVAKRLESPKITGQERMALLRRQAELGDQRDVMAERARRDAFAASV
jgi:hypothetical protein